MKRNLIQTYFFLFLILFIGISFCYAQEQITLTTYYPAPIGNYQELTAYRMKIGSTYSSPGTTVSDNNLIIEGQVGINTPNVNSAPNDLSGIKPKLTVQGTVSATGFQMNVAAVNGPLQPGAALLAADSNGNAQWVNGGAMNCVIRRDLAHAGNDNSWVMCHANETVTGGGAIQSSGNNNSDYPFVSGVILPSDGDSPLGGGWGCFNQSDGCTAFAVCCTF